MRPFNVPLIEEARTCIMYGVHIRVLVHMQGNEFCSTTSRRYLLEHPDQPVKTVLDP